MRVTSALLLFFLCAPLPGWAATPGRNSIRNVEAAKREWERVIAAKGGRERLHSVKSLGVRYVAKATRGTPYGRYVYDFPSRVWCRFQDAPYKRNMSPLTFINVWDAGAGIGWFIVAPQTPTPSDPVIGPRVSDAPVALVRENICRASTLYLLETKWYQPEIVAVDESTWIGKDVLVIYVKSCDGPAAYVINPKTKLPVAYVGFGIREFGAKLPPLPKRRGIVWRLDDYAPIDGLLMPRKTTFGEMKYEINRDYPDSLFTKPPKLSDWGPWPAPEQK